MWNLSAAQYDLRYQGDYLPGSYTDGDIVVFNGVTYLCVRPTSNPPTPWTPPQLSPTYGTTLPANPVDGQEHILTNSVTAPAYQWRLRYNTQSTSAYKWEFVGGCPGTVFVPANETALTTGAWHDLTTMGPSFTVPRTGDYIVAASSIINPTGGVDQTAGFIGVARGASSPSEAQGGAANTSARYGNGAISPIRMADVTGELRLRYFVAVAGPTYFYNRALSVTPVRVQ